MRKLRVPISNFQFGEVSPSLISRTDSQVYQNSAQKVENFFLRAEGGIIKRMGLKNIYEFDTTVDTSKVQQHRIIPFIFSDDERYIVSLENLKIRVFRVDTSFNVTLAATVTQDTSSNALPITHDNIHELTYAQSGDTMFLAHNTFMVRKLVRTGLTSFQMETKTFDGNSANTLIHQPYFGFASAGVTLDPSASSGTGITLTTSSAYFDITGSQSGGDYPDSKHVNVTLRYFGSEIKITSVQSATSATGTVFGNLKRRITADSFRTTEGVGTVEVTLVGHGLTASDAFTISNASSAGGIAPSNLNGSRTVAEVIDENKFTFTAGANATSATAGGGTPNIETHAPTTEFKEQSYSSLRGFPGAVAFHQNRLWYGGTLGQPDGIWGSKTGTFFNFDIGDAEDNDALDLTTAIGEINTIRHIISNKDLHVFTSTDEFIIPALQGQVTTPTNASIERQTSFGSSFLRPYIYDGATVFVDSSGSMVREFIFTDAVNGYTGNSISTLSSHLIKTPVQMAMLSGAIGRAENYLFIVDADGTLAVFNSNRVEKRAGYTQFTSQGSFHSVCVIDTHVYAVVKFDKGDGTNKYFLVEFDNSFNMDLAKTYSGSNGVFSVSSDFANGAVVDVVNGTFYLGSFTVSGGNVDVSSVDSALSSAEIGLKFNVNLITNPIDAQVADGPLTSEPRTVQRVVLDLNNTLSVNVNNNELIIRQVTDDFSLARTPVTGKKEFRLLGFGGDPQVTVSQTAPLSLQINSLVAEIAF